MSEQLSTAPAEEPIIPSVSINRITFFNGDEIQLQEKEKIIIVGANNCGKSQLLSDIDQILRAGPGDINKILADVSISKSLQSKDLRNFLKKNADKTENGFRYKDWTVNDHEINHWDGDYLKHTLAGGFIKVLSSGARLNICRQQESIAPNQQKSKPQHILYDSDEAMSRISKLFRAAFGKDLMFDFRGGKLLPIHIGDIPNRKISPIVKIPIIY